MLRFAFMGEHASREQTKRFLRTFASASTKYVKELERQLATFPDEVPLQPRLALMHGIESYKGDARWARQALKAIEKEKK